MFLLIRVLLVPLLINRVYSINKNIFVETIVLKVTAYAIRLHVISIILFFYSVFVSYFEITLSVIGLGGLVSMFDNADSILRRDIKISDLINIDKEVLNPGKSLSNKNKVSNKNPRFKLYIPAVF